MVTASVAWLLVATAVPAAGQGLTEAQAVELALQNSPQLQAHGHAVDEAAALTEASLAWNNPLLRISGARSDQLLEPALQGRSYGDHPFFHASIGLRWSPPGLGERALRRADGLARETEARMQLAAARRDTVALVRTLHAQILDDDRQLALLRDVVEQREQLRALIGQRLALQSATLLDQSLTEVEYLDARSQLAELELRRRAAFDQLRIQLGLPTGASITLAPSADTCGTPEDVAGTTAKARRVDPQVPVLEMQLGAVDVERRRRRLQLLPWFDYLQVGYGFAGDQRSGFVALQLQLTLPVLDWKGPHRRALQARAQGLAARLQAEDRAVAEGVLRATAMQAEQSALVERYRAAATVAERGLADLRKALAQSGPATLAEVVQLHTRVLVMQRASLRAQLQCKLQQIELDRLTSTGLEKGD